MHKRKRPGQRFNVTSSSESQPSSNVDSNTTSQSYTYTRNMQTGRLGGRQDTVELEISSEDMEILQRHEEFCLPSESLLDFEALIQTETADGSVTADHDPAEISATASVSIRVCAVIRVVLIWMLRQHLMKNGSLLERTILKSFYGMMAVRLLICHARCAMLKTTASSSAWTALAQQCSASTA